MVIRNGSNRNLEYPCFSQSLHYKVFLWYFNFPVKRKNKLKTDSSISSFCFVLEEKCQCPETDTLCPWSHSGKATGPLLSSAQRAPPLDRAVTVGFATCPSTKYVTKSICHSATQQESTRMDQAPRSLGNEEGHTPRSPRWEARELHEVTIALW